MKKIFFSIMMMSVFSICQAQKTQQGSIGNATDFKILRDNINKAHVDYFNKQKEADKAAETLRLKLEETIKAMELKTKKVDTELNQVLIALLKATQWNQDALKMRTDARTAVENKLKTIN